MSMSSESFDFLECCEFSLFGMLLWSTASGTWMDSGNGDVGRGFCDANALAPKLARVGVVASSMVADGLGGPGSAGAVLGLGVIGDAIAVSSLMVSAGVNGVLTGRKAAAMVVGVGIESAMEECSRNQDCRAGEEG
jgi:hypothetical protein